MRLLRVAFAMMPSDGRPPGNEPAEIEASVFEIGSVYPRAAEAGFFQMRPYHLGAPKVHSGEIAADPSKERSQVCIPQVCAVETNGCSLCEAEIGASEITADEIGKT